MNVELNKDELSLILDALAMQPLAKAYNLFNRLAVLLQDPVPPQDPPPPQ